MRFSNKSVVAFVGVLALGASLVGCGSSQGTATASASKATLANVTVGDFPASALTLPFAIAQDQGYFRAAGLNVQTLMATSGPTLVSGLIGGTTQIAVEVPPNAFPAMQQGEPIVALAPYGRLDLAVVAPSSGGITSLKSLVGKKIGVTALGAFTEKFAQYVLQANGINPSSVTFLAVGALPTQELALQHHEIDASVFSSDAIAAAGAHGINLRVLAGSLEGTAGTLGNVGLQSFWATTSGYQRSHPAVVKGFCTAMTNAVTFLQNDANRSAGVKTIETLLSVPASVAGQVWDTVHLAWSTSVTQAKWNANVSLILGGSASLAFDKFIAPGCG